MAVFGVGYSSLLFADRFNSTPLATVVESIIYPVSDIPYPSVTVCLNNRLSWKRILEMEKLSGAH
jgi:Amiloride-sensitive sodium channel